MLLSSLKVQMFEQGPLNTCQQLKSVRKHVNTAGKPNRFTGNFLGICKCSGFFASGSRATDLSCGSQRELLKATLAPQEGRLLWNSAVNL